MAKIKLSTEDYKKWQNFKSSNSNTLDEGEQKFLARLHSEYFNHQYHVPCTCSPKTYNNWIQDINNLYNNGQ